MRHKSFFTKPSQRIEFQVHIPARWLPLLEKLGGKYGLTISGILRSIARNPRRLPVPAGLKRPRRYTEAMHRIPLCMYGADKQLIRQKLLHLQLEFAPYLRYLLDAYTPILEDVLQEFYFNKKQKRFTNSQTVKQGKGGYVIEYQTKTRIYSKDEFWPVDPIRNIQLMHYGRHGVWLNGKGVRRLMDSLRNWRLPRGEP